MKTMRLRELGGAIRSAKNVYLFVPYAVEEPEEGDAEGSPTEVGVWLMVPRTLAREIIDEARSNAIEAIAARAEGGQVFIGLCDD